MKEVIFQNKQFAFFITGMYVAINVAKTTVMISSGTMESAALQDKAARSIYQNKNRIIDIINLFLFSMLHYIIIIN